jgi:hypothetical protein
MTLQKTKAKSSPEWTEAAARQILMHHPFPRSKDRGLTDELFFAIPFLPDFFRKSQPFRGVTALIPKHDCAWFAPLLRF